jgi:hypothetical protein
MKDARGVTNAGEHGERQLMARVPAPQPRVALDGRMRGRACYAPASGVRFLSKSRRRWSRWVSLSVPLA